MNKCNLNYLNVGSNTICCLMNKLERRNVPILMIHGLGASSNDFAEAANVAELSDRTLLIPDLLGFGKSDKPIDFSYDLMEQAMVVNGLLENLNIKKVDVVAHSMGGVVAILFAKIFPEKLNKLVVAEPNFNPDHAKISIRIKDYGTEDNFKEHFSDFIEIFNRKDKPSSLRFYQTLYQSTYYSLYRSAISLLKRSEPPLYQDFLNLELPKYFLKGEKSYHEIDQKTIKDFEDYGIQFYVIPDAGHGMMGDNPEVFYSVVNKVLR